MDGKSREADEASSHGSEGWSEEASEAQLNFEREQLDFEIPTRYYIQSYLLHPPSLLIRLHSLSTSINGFHEARLALGEPKKEANKSGVLTCIIEQGGPYTGPI